MIQKLRKYLRRKFMIADFNSWTQVFWYVLYILVGSGKPLKSELGGLVEAIKDAIAEPSRPSNLSKED